MRKDLIQNIALFILGMAFLVLADLSDNKSVTVILATWAGASIMYLFRNLQESKHD